MFVPLSKIVKETEMFAAYMQISAGCIIRMKNRNQQCQQVGPDDLSPQKKIGIMSE